MQGGEEEQSPARVPVALGGGGDAKGVEDKGGVQSGGGVATSGRAGRGLAAVGSGCVERGGRGGAPGGREGGGVVGGRGYVAAVKQGAS